MNDIITQDTYDIIKHQARDLDLVVINRDAYITHKIETAVTEEKRKANKAEWLV